MSEKSGEERRESSRVPLVLAAEMVELPNGSPVLARTSDVSVTGCYIDTINALSLGARLRLRLTNHGEILEVNCRVVYVSPRLGMGLRFQEMSNEQRERLRSWLLERDNAER